MWFFELFISFLNINLSKIKCSKNVKYNKTSKMCYITLHCDYKQFRDVAYL